MDDSTKLDEETNKRPRIQSLQELRVALLVA